MSRESMYPDRIDAVPPDTSTLLRTLQPRHPDYAVAVRGLRRCRSKAGSCISFPKT